MPFPNPTPFTNLGSRHCHDAMPRSPQQMQMQMQLIAWRVLGKDGREGLTSAVNTLVSVEFGMYCFPRSGVIKGRFKQNSPRHKNQVETDALELCITLLDRFCFPLLSL